MKILCLKEVADRVRVSERTAARLLQAGELPGFKLGRVWRASEEQLERRLREKQEERRPAA